MLRDSMENAGEDMQKRLLQEQKVDASRVLEAIGSALAEDGNEHLSSKEREQIDNLIAALAKTQQGTDADAIKSAIGELERGCSEFVERRMNASVRRVMSGQDLNDIDAAMRADVSEAVEK